MKKLLILALVLLVLQASYGLEFLGNRQEKLPLIGGHTIQNIPLTARDKALMYQTAFLTGIASYLALNNGLNIQPGTSWGSSLWLGSLSSYLGGCLAYNNSAHAKIKEVSHSLQSIKKEALEVISTIYEKINQSSPLKRQSSIFDLDELQKAFVGKSPAIITPNTAVSVIKTLEHYQDILKKALTKIKGQDLLTLKNESLEALLTGTSEKVAAVKKYLETKQMELNNSEDDDNTLSSEDDEHSRRSTPPNSPTTQRLTAESLKELNAKTGTTKIEQKKDEDSQSESSYHSAKSTLKDHYTFIGKRLKAPVRRVKSIKKAIKSLTGNQDVFLNDVLPTIQKQR